MCIGAYPGGQFEDVWDENKKFHVPRTVHVGYVIEILGMDEVIEFVSSNYILLREHQDLLEWAQHIIATFGIEKIDTKIPQEMQERFSDFIGCFNEAAFQFCGNEEEPFEISVFPK